MDLETLITRLPAGTLPTGRLVASDDGDGPARHWRSDAPAPAGLWQRLRAAHPGTGLWPVLLDELGPDDPDPWDEDDLEPASPPSVDASTVPHLLAGWWRDHTSAVDDMPVRDEELDHLHPYRSRWPGPAPVGRSPYDPHEVADAVARDLDGRGHRLGLVAAQRGADVPGATRWYGAGNYIGDPAELSAVLRFWEDRFGARLVAIGFDTVVLSVAAPPTTPEHALHLAAEHYAVCPDLVLQGSGDLEGYANSLARAHTWHFWWD